MSNKDKKILQARHTLWRQGKLSWKLDITQKKMLDFFNENKSKITVLNCSRRLGKSYYLTILGIEKALQEPKSIVKFLQPEQKMIRMNIKPIMDKIFSDAPPELVPKFSTKDNVYMFSNGSQIQLAGMDNGNHEKIRGGDAHLCLVDEAGFASDLSYVVNSVLVPTTTLTKGKIILSSTPPRSADHEFIEYAKGAELDGRLMKKTIYEALEDQKKMKNPRITEEMIGEIIATYPGGTKSTEFRREYLAEIVTDEDSAVIPEFTTEVQEDIVASWPRPIFFDRYVSMDIGFKDLTVVLFGYYDFQNAVIVVEDEIVMNGIKMTTPALAEAIKQKEKELWTVLVTGEFFEPYLRISDNNLIVINDLQREHQLTFLPTPKDNKEAAINAVRTAVAGHQLYINPKAKTLIHHLKNGTWDKARKSFTRSPDNGHYDAIDALIYLVRNIDKNKNPFPKGYNPTHSTNTFLNPYSQPEENYEGFKNLFKKKSSVKR